MQLSPFLDTLCSDMIQNARKKANTVESAHDSAARNIYNQQQGKIAFKNR